jgi:hypothetical protein
MEPTRIDSSAARMPGALRGILLVMISSLGVFGCGFAATGAVAAQADPALQALERQSTALLQQLHPLARTTALRISDTGRRLLAMRAYLRAGESLSDRWSWTDAQHTAFQASAEGKALRDGTDAVRCAFATANPGYSLFVNPEFRSTAIQTDRWNRNETTGRAAARLLEMARVAIPTSTTAGSAAEASWLRQWLIAHAPQPVPTLAAPGLSPHGRGNAVDFQVMRDGRLVAGPDSTTIKKAWQQSGWSDRLAQAVATSGAPFAGPLQSPHEPWHYRYAPGTEAAVALAGCVRNGLDDARAFAISRDGGKRS